MTLLSVGIGLVLSIIIAALGYQRGSLTPSGVVGAVLVGTLVFAGGGLAWGVLLVAFFVTSSALSHFAESKKEQLAEKFQKGHRRDIGQVFANGGWGALLALTFAFFPRPILFAAFAGAMAGVNADTWATELGVLSGSEPRLVTTGRVVPTGTSGGVTRLGTTAALAGALLIGLIAAVCAALSSQFPGLFPAVPNALVLVFIGAGAGLLGSLFDSVLGATVQAIYFCDYDQKETESALHRCGHATRLVRGWRWMDNDWVNLLASVFSSLLAAAAYGSIGGIG